MKKLAAKRVVRERLAYIEAYLYFGSVSKAAKTLGFNKGLVAYYVKNASHTKLSQWITWWNVTLFIF
jgi:hypothetical protein